MESERRFSKFEREADFRNLALSFPVWHQFASHAPMLCQALKNRARDVCRWREIRVGQRSVEPQILHADFECDRFAFSERQPDCLCGKQIKWIAKTIMQENHPENHDA